MSVEAAVSGLDAGAVEATGKFRRRAPLVEVIRILVVDDFEPWKAVIRRILAGWSCLQIVGDACDGLEAIQKAGNLQPDLILLDMAMPRLNGVEAARKIREVAAKSKILFLSQESSQDIAQEIVNEGAHGYVLKKRAETDLLLAINAVLEGKPFFSPGLKD